MCFICFFVNLTTEGNVLGVKVEGILRQAADVDDVERRVREYEQGLCEFDLVSVTFVKFYVFDITLQNVHTMG